MASEVKVPTLGESVSEATIGEWLKKPGDQVKLDEPIASLETDKVAVEVPAPVAGVMGEQKVAVGDTVEVGAVIALIEDSSAAGETTQVAPRDEAQPADQKPPASTSVPAPAPSSDESDQTTTLSPSKARARRILRESRRMKSAPTNTIPPHTTTMVGVFTRRRPIS